jgi:hypothetical protein
VPPIDDRIALGLADRLHRKLRIDALWSPRRRM